LDWSIFTLAEDVVQATLARALQTWPFYGVPKNPAGWIMRASRNVALDAVRREKVFRDKEGEQLTEEDRKIMNQYVIRGKD
jgi:RNA polymerase sigma-70 factor (ECF subfamily)